jgi:hypothetical protein
MHPTFNMENVARFRRRLATETDVAITAALTHLLKKEIDRHAIASQERMDKRGAAS